MRIKDFSQLEVRGFLAQFVQILIDYDGGANPVYVGYNQQPQAGQDSPTWFIIKLYYDGSGNMIRQQLPLKGVRFAYKWTERATTF